MLKALNRLLCSTLFIFCAAVSADDVSADDIDQKLDLLDVSILKDIDTSSASINELFGLFDSLSRAQKIRLYIFESVRLILAGKYESALQTLDKALLLNPNDEQLTNIYAYKISASIPLKRYEDAFSLLEKSLARIDSFQDNSIKISSYVRLMNTYLDLDKYDEVLRLSKIVFMLNKGQDSKSHCYAMVLTSTAQLSLNQIPYLEQLQLFADTQDYCQQNNFPLIAAMAIKGKAIVEFEHHHYQTAEVLFLKALAAYQPFNFELEINNIYAYLSEVYFQLQQFQQAVEYAELVDKLTNEPNNYKAKQRAYNVLSMVASKRGQFKVAYQYHVQAHAIGMLLINDKKVKETAYQVAKFDNAEKTRQLNKLAQDQEMLAKERSIMNNEKSASFMFSTVLTGTVAFLSLLLATAWMQRNQFRKQAQIDLLTGLLNRGTGEEKAEDEFVQVLARGGQYSVIVIDLDFFKQINDTFGHGTGDWALKKVAEVITANTRSTDIVSRMGGEEFAIFMPFTTIELAVELAKKIRFDIESIDTRFSGHQFTITASFGVSQITADDLSLDLIINRADTALYKAKSEGRNKVVYLS
ncbi:GGDEF domain-containing protein [Shewanella sp. 5_MG-2023]|uniref:tetratricopeptide repeat-containing diguanylate cyclase n=1 Tax=Shewanella sp. 5_MG-2023 TaxID=3062656 RepID=UPI0026E317A0|nr:GGDEF domain-containing protein [Shewanella sp. 5_MG-2023]MDO6641066.1 GGDEF domain-containing protein [Shewanella sp. 5_MG-2023]